MNGEESLQSDVMRFMAILALCLAAIFALVKSAPLASVGEPASLVSISSAPEAAPPAPATGAPAARVPVKSVTLPGSEKVLPPKPKPDPAPREQRARPAPLSQPASSPPASTEPSVPVDGKGFTLRFASATALKTLMARGEVEVFARARRDIWRLRLDDGRLRFESARAPARFHEMSHETVPAEMVSALRRDAVARDLGEVTWGVTLPPRVTAQIGRALDEHHGGSLVIEGDGRISLDPGDSR